MGYKKFKKLKPMWLETIESAKEETAKENINKIREYNKLHNIEFTKSGFKIHKHLRVCPVCGAKVYIVARNQPYYISQEDKKQTTGARGYWKCKQCGSKGTEDIVITLTVSNNGKEN